MTYNSGIRAAAALMAQYANGNHEDRNRAAAVLGLLREEAGLITLAEQKTGLESAPDRPGPTNEIDVTPEMVRAAIHAYYCGLDPRWHSDEDIFEYVCREIFKFAGLRVRGSD